MNLPMNACSSYSAALDSRQAEMALMQMRNPEVARKGEWLLKTVQNDNIGNEKCSLPYGIKLLIYAG